MTDQLPPLPEPTFHVDCVDEPPIPVFTDWQMRAYAQEAARQERERCAKEAEHWQKIGTNPSHKCGEYIAAAIRSTGDAAAIRARSAASGEKT